MPTDPKKRLIPIRVVGTLLWLIAISVGVPVVVGVIKLVLNVVSNWPESLPSTDKTTIRALNMLTSVGLISLLFQRSLKKLKESLQTIWHQVRDIWTPGDNSELDLGKIPGRTFSAILSFGLYVSIMCIAIVCGSIAIKPSEKVDGRGIIVSNWSDPPPTYLFEKGARISLLYPPQGDLASKASICPDSVNQKWLTLLKSAILQCSQNDSVKLTIRAFASIAPVYRKGTRDTTGSDTFNHMIAEQRAEALIYYLTLADSIKYTQENCESAVTEKRIWQGQGSAKSDSTWTIPGYKVAVNYNPWDDYSVMELAKLAKDGSSGNRKRAIEFLNRAVQVIIDEGGCLTEEVENGSKQG